MWHSKKFIIIGVVVALLLVGSIGGIAYAQAGNGDGPAALLDKVCEIYQQKTGTTIDQAALKDAFAQAMKEMRPKAPRERLQAPKDRPEMTPEAMQERLQNLVDNDKLTQEQADQLKAWLDAKPDTTAFEQQMKEWQDAMPEMPAEMKAWMEDRPEIPFGFGFPGHGRFPGMGGPPPFPPPAE